jgi:hypothetical protein
MDYIQLVKQIKTTNFIFWIVFKLFSQHLQQPDLGNLLYKLLEKE